MAVKEDTVSLQYNHERNEWREKDGGDLRSGRHSCYSLQHVNKGKIILEIFTNAPG